MSNAVLGANYLELKTYASGRLNQTVDLTGFKYLKVQGKANNAIVNGYKFSIGVSKSSSAMESDMARANTLDTRSSMAEYNILDISLLQGGYYIYVYSVYTRSSAGNLSPDKGIIYEIFMTTT